MTPPVQPVQPKPPLLERLWTNATQAIHRGAKQSDVDADVRFYTNGHINSFQDLARVREAHQRIANNAEQDRLGVPGKNTAAAISIANGMALGIPEKFGNMTDPVGGAPPLPGGQQPQNQFLSEVNDLLNRSREAHPWGSLVGELEGNAVPSGIAGELAPATKILSGLHRIPLLGRLMPGLARSAVEGGIRAGTAGAVSSYGLSPDITPHPKEIAKSAGVSALTGAAIAPAVTWLATKLNPAPHLLGRAVQESTPSDVPSEGAGTRTLESGTGTPMRVGPPAKNLTMEPISEEANAQLPLELQRMNWEKSAALRATAAKQITQSPEAAAQAEQLLNQRLTAVRTAVRGIENDPASGYDAILSKVPITDEIRESLPDEAQRYLSRQGGNPTARDLFNYTKQLSQDADRAFRMQKQASGNPDLELATRQSRMATDLRARLNELVPELGSLQQRVAPYLQREQQLIWGKRQLIGRAVKPLGQTAPAPKGRLLEGMKESLGYESSQVMERARRSMVSPLFSTKMSDLMNAIEQRPTLAHPSLWALRGMPSFAGAVSGGLTKRGNE